MARIRNLYPDGTTLAWKTSIWYSKLYIKANEMQLPRYRKLIKILNSEELDYRNKIINYCNAVGLVRDEKEFKQSFLNRNNLCSYGLVTEKDFLPYLTDIDNLLNKIEISTMEYEHISDILLERGICKSRQSANSTQSYVFAWLYGQPIIKNSQFYVHQSRLDQLGINLRKPYDATKLMPQLRSNKEITVSTLSPPDWYKMPSVKNLKLVS